MTSQQGSLEGGIDLQRLEPIFRLGNRSGELLCHRQSQASSQVSAQDGDANLGTVLGRFSSSDLFHATCAAGSVFTLITTLMLPRVALE